LNGALEVAFAIGKSEPFAGVADLRTQGMRVKTETLFDAKMLAVMGDALP